MNFYTKFFNYKIRNTAYMYIHMYVTVFKNIYNIFTNSLESNSTSADILISLYNASIAFNFL